MANTRNANTQSKLLKVNAECKVRARKLFLIFPEVLESRHSLEHLRKGIAPP
jgi:hypothetical protein